MISDLVPKVQKVRDLDATTPTTSVKGIRPFGAASLRQLVFPGKGCDYIIYIIAIHKIWNLHGRSKKKFVIQKLG